MPEDPDLDAAPGARSLIRNGLMQNDLDADFHKILNLDLSNLNFGGPNNFPAQAHKWLTSYNSTTRNFAATQPDILNADILNFPSIAGQAQKFLTNDGAVMSWATTPSGGATNGWINVKDAPYNATGDGVTNDAPAILAAINAANGRTVYFPKGVYYLGQNIDVTAINGVTLVGENPALSILLGAKTLGGAVLKLGSNSFIQRLTFHGNMNAALDGVTVIQNGRVGLWVDNATNVTVRDCFAVFCSSTGILATYCYSQLFVQNCSVGSCGVNGIWIAQSPRTTIANNSVFDCPNGSGIAVINSQQSIVKHNSVFRCGHQSFSTILSTGASGIVLADSDNSVVEGNIVQQCSLGMLIANTGVRTPQLITYGYSLNANIVIRNYFGGVLLSLCNGFRFSGNNVIDNGQGGTDDNTSTLEPGIIINAPGTGYTAGQLLTVTGGTGTAAKLVVLQVGSGGSIVSVFPLSLGAYTAFPTNPVHVTPGNGSATFIMTTSRITGGLGYTRGQVLRSVSPGHNGHPAKIIITNVGSGGGVLAFGVLDGGGYTAPPASLVWTSDSMSPAGNPAGGDAIDIGDTGSGLTIVPMWGKRFSSGNNGQKAFGLGTLGPVQSGLMGGNIIDQNLGSGIQLMEIPSSDWTGRAQLLIINGNHVLLNTTSIKGWVIGTPTLDCNVTLNNMIANNFIFPADCGNLTDNNTSPFA